MTVEQQPVIKRGRGRPLGTKKAVGGKTMWIPAEIIDTVQSMVQSVKQKQNNQQVQQ